MVSTYGEEDDHLADIWLSEQGRNRPLVLFIHGGYWRPQVDRQHARPLAGELHSRGWAVGSVEYPRVPGEPDRAHHAVHEAVHTLPRALGFDDVLLAGHSAGGQLALWLASTLPPESLRGVLALAPVADLTQAYELGLGEGAVADFFRSGPAERPDLDPLRLPSPQVPTTVLHGADDTRVPLGISEDYAAAHPQVRLTVVPGAGHFSLIDPQSPQWDAVPRALENLVQ